MDLGVAWCRQSFDDNRLDNPRENKVRRATDFCCQVVQNDSTEEIVIAKISIAKSTSNNQEAFQIDGDDYSMGALLFAGAQTVAGSVVTMVAAAVMFQ